jgi:segregation and condensation protein B
MTALNDDAENPILIPQAPDLSSTDKSLLSSNDDQFADGKTGSSHVQASVPAAFRIFSADGQAELQIQEAAEGLAKQLSETSRVFSESPDGRTPVAEPLADDSGRDEEGPAEILSGSGALDDELLTRYSLASPEPPKKSGGKLRGKPQALTVPEKPQSSNEDQTESEAAMGAAPLQHLPETEDDSTTQITLKYTAFFAEPDPDCETVQRIETPEQAMVVLEGLLFATSDPISLSRLSKITGLHPTTLTELLTKLKLRVQNRDGALCLLELAGGYQLGTRPELNDWMIRLQKQRRRPTLSNPALETLAIIAYRQPVTRGEIEAIRGVDSSGAVRVLQDLGLVEVGGKKEVVGRPSLFVTTEGFLKTFGLLSLADLPPMAELLGQGSTTISAGKPAEETILSPSPASPAPPEATSSAESPDSFPGSSENSDVEIAPEIPSPTFLEN